MKQFKVRDGKVIVDGIVYFDSPTPDVNIKGKSGGRVHSINITGYGQFFPLSGVFNDGTTPIVDTPTETKVKKTKLAKTELVEKSGVVVDESGNIVKRKSKKTK